MALPITLLAPETSMSLSSLLLVMRERPTVLSRKQEQTCRTKHSEPICRLYVIAQQSILQPSNAQEKIGYNIVETSAFCDSAFIISSVLTQFEVVIFSCTVLCIVLSIRGAPKGNDCDVTW
jgi:hypothetical protein